jgi:exopolysaccharide biosynthesis operon protein EpsL
LPVRRQRFLAGVRWDQHRYEQYSVLDFTDHDGQAIWKWQAGNDLAGELGYTETLELASLANIQGDVQSSAPNPLKTQRKFLNAAYMLTPRWRLRGEVSRGEQSNTVFTENDIGINGADLTGSYVTRADNQVGVNLRVADGNFPNGQTVGTEIIDNDYRQRTIAAVLDWTLTGHSRMSARAGWINRNYEQLSERDFDGPMYRVVYVWTPTGKFILTAIAQRDISTDEQVNTSFAYVRGVTLYPALRLTEKFELSGGLEWGRRDYLGDPELVLSGTTRTDRVRTTALTATYKPLRRVTLEMRWRHESRSSTIATADYVDDIVSVSAGIRF